MIKRKYFLSIKVSHNNNTGEYSYWNGLFTCKSWSNDRDVEYARYQGVDLLSGLVDRDIVVDDIEILAFNRI